MDVTEAECSMILVHLLTAIFGHHIWKISIPFFSFNLELRILLIASSMAFALWTIARNLKIIGGGATLLDNLVSIPRRQGIRILYPAVPIVMFVALILSATNNLFLQSPSFFLPHLWLRLLETNLEITDF